MSGAKHGARRRLRSADSVGRSVPGVAEASSQDVGTARLIRVDFKPGFVSIPRCRGTGEDHSSRRRVAATLERSHPGAVSSFRMRIRPDRPQRHPYSSLLREGLASSPVTRLSRVGSYPTISPLPGEREALATPLGPEVDRCSSAVSFLLRFPSGHPGSVLPTSLSYGARTFLPRTMRVRRRSSVHLRPTPSS